MAQEGNWNDSSSNERMGQPQGPREKQEATKSTAAKSGDLIGKSLSKKKASNTKLVTGRITRDTSLIGLNTRQWKTFLKCGKTRGSNRGGLHGYTSLTMRGSVC